LSNKEKYLYSTKNGGDFVNIYDEGVFLSHLEMEIQKNKRFGYPFSLILIKALNAHIHTIALLTSLLEAHYRLTDLVAKRNDGSFIILLNGTTEDKAQHYMGRLIQKAVSENDIPVVAAVTSLKNEDDSSSLIERLKKKIQQ
jgi:GGDEF domain-containing protein